MIIKACVTLVLTLAVNSAVAEDHLSASWGQLIDGLQETQQSLTDPESFPPQLTDRNLAEGYRYMLAHLSRLIEMEMRLHPRYPEFYRSMDMLRKWTGENPDAMYLKAPIDSTGYYKISGTAADTQEWMTSERGASAPKAPRMVTFQMCLDRRDDLQKCRPVRVKHWTT